MAGEKENLKEEKKVDPLRELREEMEARVVGELIKVFHEKLREVPQEIKDEILEKTVEKLPDVISKNIDNISRIVVQGAIRDAIRAQNKLLKEYKKAERRREREEMIQRFNLQFRIQHMILFTSVIILIFTGIPMKFPDLPIFNWIVYALGGFENNRLFHRFGAILLIFFMFYHTLYTIFHKEGRRDFLLLLPRPQDVFNLIKNIRYFLGFSDERPKFGRFSYIEKFDYWAVYWGCIIMIGSGIFLWAQDLTLKYLPKYFLDISKEAHSDEALLATLAIVIWHFYNVHFNPSKFPGSLTWFHGKITKQEMIEEHPLEYEEIVKKVKGNEEHSNKLLE